MPFFLSSWTGIGQALLNLPYSLISIGLADSIHRFDHILNHLLGITKDHHGFVHVEELIVESSKNKDLERYKKEQEELNLSIKKLHPKFKY